LGIAEEFDDGRFKTGIASTQLFTEVETYE
jgi:hypothetical protein